MMKMTHFEKDYAVICDCSDGLYRVSTIDFDDSDMLYRTYDCPFENIPGIWGYVDGKGREIIAPQYIYAHGFSKGSAIVVKGKWERRKEWNDKYWTDEQLWGMINKTGKEIIPCKFDEIKYFMNHGTEEAESSEQYGASSYLMAHFGGWQNGNWGVIDYSGNWVVPPLFCYIDYYIYNDDLVLFREEPNSFEELLGVYSIKQKRILYEPQFIEVTFNPGSITLEGYEKTRKTVVVKYEDITSLAFFGANAQKKCFLSGSCSETEVSEQP